MESDPLKIMVKIPGILDSALQIPNSPAALWDLQRENHELADLESAFDMCTN
jgi:hypothetical protein